MFFTVFNAYTPHFQTKLRRIDLSHSNHNCVVVSSTGIWTLTKKDFGFETQRNVFEMPSSSHFFFAIVYLCNMFKCLGAP